MLSNEQRRVTSSERFPCWITIEDISLSLSGSASQEISFWDEIRVSFEREGVTQSTRWNSPILATTDIQLSNSGGSDGGSDDKSKGIIAMRWSSLNTAAFLVYFRPEDASRNEPLDPSYERQVHSKNLQYLVSASDSNIPEASNRNVRPKTIRPLICSVECQKKGNIFSASGGAEVEQRPTSAGVETVSSYYAKGSSWLSALIKKASLKLTTERGGDSLPEMHTVKDSSEPRILPPRGSHNTNNVVVYATEKNGIDPSEAYNAPGGKQQFSLELCPSNGYASADIAGAPLTLHFTMVAHFERDYLPPLRNYHSNVILLDQVVLDVSDANRNATSKKISFGKFPYHSTSSTKTVEAYGFGFTSNTSRRHDLQYTSPLISTSFLEDEGDSRIIDFTLLPLLHNERESSQTEFEQNPTSVCIVSSGCDIRANRVQIGNRVVSVSRFKTAINGLCKPSYKCHLVLGLLRRYNNGEVEVERCAHPIDLSSIINREYYPDKVRQVIFSRGEVMNFRLRRRCFTSTEYHCCELLTPYDYDTSDMGEGVLEASGPKVALNIEESSPQQENCLRVNDDDTSILNRVKKGDSICAPLSEVNATKTFFLYNNYEDGSYHSSAKKPQEADVTPKTEKAEKPTLNLTEQFISACNNGEQENEMEKNSLKFISFNEESNVLTYSRFSDDAFDHREAKDYFNTDGTPDKLVFVNPFETIDNERQDAESSASGFPYLSHWMDEKEENTQGF